jgi:outer membrane biosynthesis protein TonB
MSAFAHDDRRPAFVAAAALHVFVLTVGLIVWPWTKPIRMGDVVPVTIVTSQQASNMKPAVEAPTPAPAATEEPAPEPTPQPPAPVEAPTPAPPPMTKTRPQPQPRPTPPKPQPVQKVEPRPVPTPKPLPKAEARPAPTPKPTPPAKPAPAKPAPAKAEEPAFDPDAVLASLNKASKAAGSRHTAAPRGPTRPETAVQARLAPGTGSQVSASALSDLGSELARLWNPNCQVEGAADVRIQVSFRLDGGGRLIGDPVSSAEAASNPVVKAASDRAKRAVYQGQPFDSLPPALYGQRITVNFNAKDFCANR